MSLSVVRPDEVAPTPWRNGRGVTRELARATDASWRISIASLDADAPFSAFPGFDRIFVLLSGRVTLTIGDRRDSLTRGAIATFAGETPVTATVHEPARAANVIVARDAWTWSYGVGITTAAWTPGDGELTVLLAATETPAGTLPTGTLIHRMSAAANHAIPAPGASAATSASADPSPEIGATALRVLLAPRV